MGRKNMKKTAIISAALCLAVLAAGCATTKPKTEPASTNAVSSEVTTEAAKDSHQVTVEDLTKTTLTDSAGEYTSSLPKLIVDGVEATEINNSISSYISQIYPMTKDGDYVDGYQTRYSWGVKDCTVSIVITASAVSEDYFTSEVFNYDLDTLKPLDDSEVTKHLGMTDEEFFSKTAEIYENYCGTIPDYDLEKSIAAISFGKVKPFITSNGNPGVAGCIFYAAGSQFGGMESVRLFDMTTMERI